MNVQAVSIGKRVGAALKKFRVFIAAASCVAALPLIILVLHQEALRGEERIASLLGGEGMLFTRHVMICVLLAGASLNMLAATAFFAWLYCARRMNPDSGHNHTSSK